MEIKPFSEAWADIWDLATGPPKFIQTKVGDKPIKCYENFESPS